MTRQLALAPRAALAHGGERMRECVRERERARGTRRGIFIYAGFEERERDAFTPGLPLPTPAAVRPRLGSVYSGRLVFGRFCLLRTAARVAPQRCGRFTGGGVAVGDRGGILDRIGSKGVGRLWPVVLCLRKPWQPPALPLPPSRIGSCLWTVAAALRSGSARRPMPCMLLGGRPAFVSSLLCLLLVPSLLGYSVFFFTCYIGSLHWRHV